MRVQSLRTKWFNLKYEIRLSKSTFKIGIIKIITHREWISRKYYIESQKKILIIAVENEEKVKKFLNLSRIKRSSCIKRNGDIRINLNFARKFLKLCQEA